MDPTTYAFMECKRRSLTFFYLDFLKIRRDFEISGLAPVNRLEEA